MNREQLPEYIFGFMPILHRKLLKRRPACSLTRQQMGVLHHIFHHDGKAMKHYVQMMSMSKPNMSKVVNGLIEEGLVTRGHDDDDRRIITLHITDKGKEMIDRQYADMKAQIIENTNVLSDEDINDLLKSFETIKRIINKLEEHRED